MNAFLDNSINNMGYYEANYELAELRGVKLLLAAKYNQPAKKNVRGKQPERSTGVNGSDATETVP
ncbi:hypothetical protein MUCCIDRAFT_106332 [Mucor lusitanicus CBS 277.49]|uniref:Uncharacterized protein n=1 Tax=Mucor lusitanicus CBS 277.49 TaxID=747725 RepID=A0A168N4M4_MUCCL|nr:hypothetical protein MUCCIDRAFT_106332 [Mucor lusitanicus CBS 277.49]